jgi:hypothetical protein
MRAKQIGLYFTVFQRTMQLIKSASLPSTPANETCALFIKLQITDSEGLTGSLLKRLNTAPLNVLRSVPEVRTNGSADTTLRQLHPMANGSMA